MSHFFNDIPYKLVTIIIRYTSILLIAIFVHTHNASVPIVCHWTHVTLKGLCMYVLLYIWHTIHIYISDTKLLNGLLIKETSQSEIGFKLLRIYCWVIGSWVGRRTDGWMASHCWTYLAVGVISCHNSHVYMTPGLIARIPPASAAAADASAVAAVLYVCLPLCHGYNRIMEV